MVFTFNRRAPTRMDGWIDGPDSGICCMREWSAKPGQIKHAGKEQAFHGNFPEACGDAHQTIMEYRQGHGGVWVWLLHPLLDFHGSRVS